MATISCMTYLFIMFFIGYNNQYDAQVKAYTPTYTDIHYLQQEMLSYLLMQELWLSKLKSTWVPRLHCMFLITKLQFGIKKCVDESVFISQIILDKVYDENVDFQFSVNQTLVFM